MKLVVGTVAAVAVLVTAGSAVSSGVRLNVLAQNGTVAAYGTHFRCGGRCSLSAASGSVVVLEAAPNRFFSFGHWASACHGKATACALTLTSAASARAVFTRNSGEVLLAVGGAGSVGVVGRSEGGCGTASGSCDISWPAGTAIKLVAVPDAGGSFGGWGDACAGTSGLTCRIVVGDQTTSQVTAAFATTPAAAGEQQQLNVHTGLQAALESSLPGFVCPAESGCSAPVPTGTLVKLHAGAVSPSAAAIWGGACVGDGSDCALVVDGPTDVFGPPVTAMGPTPGPFALRVVIGGKGLVTDGHGFTCTAARQPCEKNFSYRGSVRLTAKSAPGQPPATWISLNARCRKGARCTAKVGNDPSGTTITADFKRKP